MIQKTPSHSTRPRGPFAYIGGKSRVAARLIAQFPEHVTYIEPFAGGAQVLFRKPPSRHEVLNDLDGEIVNFFRICQSHHEELIRYLRFTVASREWFQRLHSLPLAALTDIQRAARFFYIQRNAFGGLAVNQSFGYAIATPNRFNPPEIPRLIEQTHERLQLVTIEHLSYEIVLKKYDAKESLFYLDPPYWDLPLYRHSFGHSDFERLREQLASLRGKFLMSLNDVPQVRSVFRSFAIETIDLHYSVSRSERNKKRSELVIRNF